MHVVSSQVFWNLRWKKFCSFSWCFKRLVNTVVGDDDEDGGTDMLDHETGVDICNLGEVRRPVLIAVGGISEDWLDFSEGKQGWRKENRRYESKYGYHESLNI